MNIRYIQENFKFFWQNIVELSKKYAQLWHRYTNFGDITMGVFKITL